MTSIIIAIVIAWLVATALIAIAICVRSGQLTNKERDRGDYEE